MPTVANTLEAWIADAEGRLRALALALARVPLADGALALHLRALALKSALNRMREDRPSASVRAAVVDSIERLAREVRRWARPPAASGRQAVFRAHAFVPRRAEWPAAPAPSGRARASRSRRIA